MSDDAELDDMLGDTLGLSGVTAEDIKIDEQTARAAGSRAKAQAREAARPMKNIGARRYVTRNELTDGWVYIQGMERFTCRADPPPREKDEDWDPDVNERQVYSSSKFDKAFMSLAPKGKKISEVLLREKKGGIMHFESMVYRPGRPEFAGENYNIYRKSPIVLAEAATDQARTDVKFFFEHIDYILPDEESRDHLLNFLAWRIQNPSKKMKHALILQGRVKGTGKSFISDMMTEILGRINVAYPRETDLSNRFNAWAAACQFIVVEELRAVDRIKIKMNLHPMITQEIINVEFKGVDPKKFYNCFGMFLMTNEDVALIIDIGDRRYLVLKTEAVKRDKPYYAKLFELLERPDSIAAIGWMLQQRDLKGYNAAADAPETAAKTAMIDAGGSPLQQWMIENAGTWPLRARLTTIEEIVALVPKRFHSPYLDQNIAAALKGAPFYGERVRVRIKGDETSVWAINADVEVNAALESRAKAQKTGKKATNAAAREAAKVKVTSRNLWLAATYEADKVANGKGQPLDAFADDAEPAAVDEFADLM